MDVTLVMVILPLLPIAYVDVHCKMNIPRFPLNSALGLGPKKNCFSHS